jgi:hypothetical protein
MSLVRLFVTLKKQYPNNIIINWKKNLSTTSSNNNDFIQDSPRAKIRDLVQRASGAKALQDFKEAGDLGHLSQENNNSTIINNQRIIKPIQIDLLNDSKTTIPSTTSVTPNAKSSPPSIISSSLLLLSYNQLGFDRLTQWRETFIANNIANNEHIQRIELCVVESMMRLLGRSFLSRGIAKSGVSPTHTGLWLGSFQDHAKELNALNIATGYVFLIDNNGYIRYRNTGVMTENGKKSLLQEMAGVGRST